MRYILHSDLNNFYASCECLYDPSIRNKPMVVVGDVEKRHGIVLSKNQIAKKMGVKTGFTVWEAQNCCGSDLVCVGVHFERYYRLSKIVKDIYREYSDRVESFGIDEAWIDISERVHNFKEAEDLAHTIRVRVLEETGLTVSIGVSYNKVFAKLGSDLKKPNAVTVITPDNYQEKVWHLPVSDLLYVGRATNAKLHKMCINTIGDLAKTDEKLLHTLLGKNGVMLHTFACGLDDTEVRLSAHKEEVKSIGNSMTCPRDLTTIEEVSDILAILSENVAKRMKKEGVYAKEVQLWVKDNTLHTMDRQQQFFLPTNLASDLHKGALQLFKEHYMWDHTVRALGVRAVKLVQQPKQYSIFEDRGKIEKQEHLEQAIRSIRQKYGYHSIKRASVAGDEEFSEIDMEQLAHLIHPTVLHK